MNKSNLDKKAAFWEIIVPEPFILDAEISEEEFISKMVSTITQEEMSNVVFDCLQRPNNTFVIYCAEKELPKIFNFDGYTYKCKIEKFDNHILLEVRDKENEYIGRGEIVKIGEKTPKDKARALLTSHMKDFVKKFEKGSRRMDAIRCKMKLLKGGMDKTSSGRLFS